MDANIHIQEIQTILIFVMHIILEQTWLSMLVHIDLLIHILFLMAKKADADFAITIIEYWWQAE